MVLHSRYIASTEQENIQRKTSNARISNVEAAKILDTCVKGRKSVYEFPTIVFTKLELTHLLQVASKLPTYEEKIGFLNRMASCKPSTRHSSRYWVKRASIESSTNHYNEAYECFLNGWFAEPQDYLKRNCDKFIKSLVKKGHQDLADDLLCRLEPGIDHKKHMVGRMTEGFQKNTFHFDFSPTLEKKSVVILQDEPKSPKYTPLKKKAQRKESERKESEKLKSKRELPWMDDELHESHQTSDDDQMNDSSLLQDSLSDSYYEQVRQSRETMEILSPEQDSSVPVVNRIQRKYHPIDSDDDDELVQKEFLTQAKTPTKQTTKQESTTPLKSPFDFSKLVQKTGFTPKTSNVFGHYQESLQPQQLFQDSIFREPKPVNIFKTPSRNNLPQETPEAQKGTPNTHRVYIYQPMPFQSPGKRIMRKSPTPKRNLAFQETQLVYSSPMVDASPMTDSSPEKVNMSYRHEDSYHELNDFISPVKSEPEEVFFMTHPDPVTRKQRIRLARKFSFLTRVDADGNPLDDTQTMRRGCGRCGVSRNL